MMRSFVLMSVVLAVANAFQVVPAVCRPMTLLRADTQDAGERIEVEVFLKKKYSAFHSLITKNPDIFKMASGNSTYFAPTDQAFADLGEKKQAQLEDPRNLETAQKIAAYHVIGQEAIPSVRLRTEDWTVPRPKDGSPPKLTIGGVMTMGGEVPVGRTKSGGFLGFGAKEDGGIVIGPDAKIIQSYNVGDCIVHEVDALLSPVVLWRYCDQLRIPGF